MFITEPITETIEQDHTPPLAVLNLPDGDGSFVRVEVWRNVGEFPTFRVSEINQKVGGVEIASHRFQVVRDGQ